MNKEIEKKIVSYGTQDLRFIRYLQETYHIPEYASESQLKTLFLERCGKPLERKFITMILFGRVIEAENPDDKRVFDILENNDLEPDDMFNRLVELKWEELKKDHEQSIGN